MHRVCLSFLVAVGLLVTGQAEVGRAVAQEKEKKPRDPDVIYVPTAQAVVDKIRARAQTP